MIFLVLHIVCNATQNISRLVLFESCSSEMMISLCLLCVCVHSNLSEESKQQSSELSEQLKLRAHENGAMRLELEDLRKRLEIADLMLQQVSQNIGITF